MGLHFGFFFNLLKVRFIRKPTVGSEPMNRGFADPCTVKKEPCSPFPAKGLINLALIFGKDPTSVSQTKSQ